VAKENVRKLEGETAIKAYRLMKRIRRFDQTVYELVHKNEIPGVCHEYVGEEAVAVGVCLAMQPTDVITSTHRGHGHIIAKGGKTDRMLAELYGRATGYNHGKGGSMHITDLSLGIFGANGIVGAGVPIAAGAAWASKVNKTGVVAVPFFGDGGANEGVVHETMNMASIWKLPMVFVCENNLYAISACWREMGSVENISDRAAAYNMPGETVDGMDVEAVFEATARLVERARAGEGPALIECKTYRFVGHVSAETALGLKYRSDEEIAEWMARDPIPAWEQKLVERGVASKDDIARIDQEVEEEIAAGVEYARQSPWPDVSEALKHMYAKTEPNAPAKGWVL
jgi:acetoin:2,6-dichlorophenolindophenol oxidoreductase subunit alpha